MEVSETRCGCRLRARARKERSGDWRHVEAVNQHRDRTTLGRHPEARQGGERNQGVNFLEEESHQKFLLWTSPSSSKELLQKYWNEDKLKATISKSDKWTKAPKEEADTKYKKNSNQRNEEMSNICTAEYIEVR